MTTQNLLRKYRAIVFAALLGLPMGLAAKDHESSFALKDGVILVIRHAEKPETGEGLSPEGEARANAYVDYFKDFKIDSKPLAIEHLVCTADSKASRRPRLTIEPLGKELGLPIDARFKNKQFQELADEIKSKPRGKHILICWHHGEIPELLQALGADSRQLLPKSKWPSETFDWLIQLRYDADGHLLDAKRTNEQLMPQDSN